MKILLLMILLKRLFVNLNNGKWVIKDNENIFGNNLLIELPDGSVINPIGKVFKRFANGEIDNLEYFYSVCIK